MDTLSISQHRNTFSWISIASKAYDFSRALAHIYSHVKEKDVTLTPLTHWYTKVEKTGFKSLNTVVKIMQNHYLKIINFINRRSINTSAEAVNAKVAFRRKFRGAGNAELFFFRRSNIYA